MSTKEKVLEKVVLKENISLVFKTMERKLFNYIMMPAMILTWIFGLLLVASLGFYVFLSFCDEMIDKV